MPVWVPPPPPVHVQCVRPMHRGGVRPESIGHIDSGTYPLRVHWSEQAYQASAPEVLAALETAWSVQVGQLGFRAPVSDGDALDVYLADVGAFQAWVEPLSWQDSVPGDGYMSAPTVMVIDGALPSEWIPSYAAHEFNHVLQFATDFTEPALNVWEATAVAAQAWTLGEAGAWDFDVYAYQEAPWAPSLLGDSYTIWDAYGVGWTYEYGAALWVMHLDHAYGSADGSLGPALWEAAANEGWGNDRDHLDAIEDLTGDGLGAFLDGLAVARWHTGERWASAGLPGAEAWGADEAVPVARVVDVSDLPVTLVLDPMVTGHAFVQVTGAEQVFAETRGPYIHTSAVVMDAADGVVVAVSNAGPTDLSAAEDPYVPGHLVLSLSTSAEEPTACGCATGAGAGWWGLAFVPWWRRRTHRAGQPAAL